MASTGALRFILRAIAVISIFLVIGQLVVTARHFESPTNDAVRLAGLGLPLLFLAFLNLIVWTQEHPRRNTRMYTHFANGLFLIASVLVLRAVPVTFAFAVTGCTGLLSTLAFLFEVPFQKKRAGSG